MVAPTTAELVQEIEDAQAILLPGQKSMDKLTLHYLANLSWADQLHKCYEELESRLVDIDVLRAAGVKLESLVAPVLPNGRLQGEYATGNLTFITQYPATSVITIPAGTKVFSIQEDYTRIFYQTTEAGSIGIGESEATIAAKAVVRGITGNIPAYSIIQLESAVAGISELENRLAMTGGTPDETDDELRERYFDAVQAPGRATIMMLERALNDISTVAEVKIVNYGQGDFGVLVDHSGGVAAVSTDIVACLDQNKAAGTQARGMLCGTIDADNATLLTDDVYGGQIWFRPRNHIQSEEILAGTYLDMDNATQSFSVTIPAGTHRGDMVMATLATPNSRAKKLITIPTSIDGNSYDILLGMGGPGCLYNLPELIPIDISGQIVLTDTPEVGLVNKIQTSLTAFLNSFRTGQRLEYSDALCFMQNTFDPTADDYIGQAFLGINEILQLTCSGGKQVASAIGDRITVEEDWRIEAGTVTITVVSE